MKPTYGRVSRYGWSRSPAAWIRSGRSAQSVEDAALLLEDDRRARSARFDVAQCAGASVLGRRSTSRSTDLRLGLVREHFGAGLDAEVEAAVRAALKVYESLGATVQEISLPHGKYGVATYYIIAPSEASSNLARYDGVHFGYRTDEKEMLAELAAERKQLGSGGRSSGARRSRHAAGADVSPHAGRRVSGRK